MLRLFAVTCVLLVCSAISAAPKPDPARPHLDNAAQLEKKNDLAGALAELKLALAVREKAGKDSLGAASVHGLIATNRARAGMLDEALESGQRQLALRERLLGEHLDTAEAHALVFEIYKLRGDAVNAVKHGEAAFALRGSRSSRSHAVARIRTSGRASSCRAIFERSTAALGCRRCRHRREHAAAVRAVPVAIPPYCSCSRV